jgi:hypothetical protein
MVVAFENWKRTLARYCENKETPTCLIPQRYNDSPVRSDLLKVRHIYLKGRELVAKTGKLASFLLNPL